MARPKVYVLETAGTNCDQDTRNAFELAGADAEIIHLSDIKNEYNPISGRKAKIMNAQILAFPGGFSNGDFIRSGKIFAADLEHFLGDQILEFTKSGGLAIGICNGFQTLVNYGLLPALDGGVEQTATLTYNDQQRFRCDWVRLTKPEKARECVWTRDIDKIDLPIAHGEGKFLAPEKILKRLFEKGLVQLQYADVNYNPTMTFPDNPNGSLGSITAICNETGKIFGLMPHPERYTNPNRHRLASLQKILGRDYLDSGNPHIRKMLREVGTLPTQGPGLKIFQNGVNYFK